VHQRAVHRKGLWRRMEGVRSFGRNDQKALIVLVTQIHLQSQKQIVEQLELG